jgi:6,7-dimethyl-8-ribityllumazine synthase
MSDSWDDPSESEQPSEPSEGVQDDLEATTFFAVEEEELVFEITSDTDPYGTWPTLDPVTLTAPEAPSPAPPTEDSVPEENGPSAESPAFDVEPQAEPEDRSAQTEALVEPLAPAQPDDGVEPAEIASVEHVGGEIHVPDGYTVLEGSPVGRRRAVALVVSRFNGALTDLLLARAIEALEEAGVSADAVTVVPVPGAFELPLAAMALAKTRRYSCIVALGAIVRGETAHFDFVAAEAASGLQLAGIETGVPIAFGVLTVDTVAQAEARIDRAADAVRTGLEMADMFARLRASTKAR